MEEIKIKAPAKINLGLNVVYRREDGYHNIETIFYPIKLSDIITFKKANDFSFTSDNKEIENSHDNLITKAKDLLEKESNQIFNVHIHLEKKIPVGGGLGGGSSDAASTLKSLNKIFSLGFNDEKLKTFALNLGSDVPFFINPVPCFASSRGENLERLKLNINFPLLVLNPGIHISTKWAFNNISPGIPHFNLKNLNQDILDAPRKLVSILTNDFEEIVFKNYPLVEKIKKDLYNLGALFVLMSGSGSSLFALFESNFSAEKAESKFKSNYFTYL